MQNIKIVKYSDKYHQLWDRFVHESNNGTIFHTQKFLSYHPPERFENHSILFTKNDKIIAIMPATLRKDGKNIIFSSHRGASFGGIVHDENLGVDTAHQVIDTLIKYAKHEGYSGIQLTPAPIIYQKRPSNYIDFALYINGFTYLKRELSSVVKLTLSNGEIFDIFRQESRTATRKAISYGVEIKTSDDYKTFYQILERNLSMRHNVTPTHTLYELKLLRNMFPKEIELKSAYYKNKMIAGVVNFICNSRVVLAFYISHNDEFQKYRAVNLLFYEILKDCYQKGFEYLDFGLFTVNMDPNFGLGKFKEGFGARGVFRDYYEIKF
jgi:hypothetical protein